MQATGGGYHPETVSTDPALKAGTAVRPGASAELSKGHQNGILAHAVCP